MTLVIIASLGVVHDADHACANVRDQPVRVPVTPLQARVYNLAACGVCFPHHHVWTAARAA
jgi:hypothetical protein